MASLGLNETQQWVDTLILVCVGFLAGYWTCIVVGAFNRTMSKLGEKTSPSFVLNGFMGYLSGRPNMKFLKMTLADNKTYTLSSFTVLETKALRDKYKEYTKKNDDMEKLMFETNPDGSFKIVDGDRIAIENVSEENQKKIESIQDDMLNFTINIVRQSLARRHEEFTKGKDEQAEKAITEKIMGLLDITDLRKLTHFAFTGMYQQEEFTIDMTTNLDDEVKKE